MVLQTLCFVVAWLVIDRYVSHHSPISRVRTLNEVHSCVYSAVSAMLLFLTLSHNYDDIARTLYHISKFWEYINVLTVRTSSSFIDLHFGFHHLTTAFLTFFRVLQNSEGRKTYAYFGGARFLLIGTGVEAHILWSREKNEMQVWQHMFSAGLLGSYLIFRVREMRMRRIIQDKEESKDKGA
ncbi:hypothetical protein F5Y09DRAFT_336119 [Xylaria sp. FL1042]|nr:hypothetical protein F5Y09DRAFT_336119 [Xylaria sp. FL1042]